MKGVSNIPRLRKLLLMLSSDKPGEVASAAAAITRALAAAGSDWHDLANSLTTETPKLKLVTRTRDDDDEEWREMHAYCQQRAHLLRPRERAFLDSLEDWCGELTPR